MERDHSGGRSRAPPLPPGPCFLPSYTFLYGFPKMSTMITLIVTHREIKETHGHRPAVEQGGLWEAQLWRGGWAHRQTSGPRPESQRTGASHLLQLQLALPLPHDVALIQQLLLGLLKLFLPLEARHKDWAEPGAPVGLGELRTSQAATRWHCRPSPGSHCRHQAHSQDSFRKWTASEAPFTNCQPREGLGTLQMARPSSLLQFPQRNHIQTLPLGIQGLFTHP